METKELYEKLKTYFSKNSDLMRHLNKGACWEYIISEKSTYEEDEKLHFYLHKKDEGTLEIIQEKQIKDSDLILYFTEKAILKLITDNPDADEYYSRYHDLMKNPQNEIEVDNKINKPRLKLLKLGYRNWQKDFKF